MEYYSDCKKVMIIYGMVFVNKVDIKFCQVHTYLDFAECFISIINNEAKSNMMRCKLSLNDRYDPESLKSNTRASRTLGLSAVRYKIADDAKELEAKEFISSIKTKNDLIRSFRRYYSSSDQQFLSFQKRDQKLLCFP